MECVCGGAGGGVSWSLGCVRWNFGFYILRRKVTENKPCPYHPLPPAQQQSKTSLGVTLTLPVPGDIFKKPMLTIRHTLFLLAYIFDIRDIPVNQTIENKPRLFYMQIKLINVRVIISEYSLLDWYINMFMTSSIDRTKNTHHVRRFFFSPCDTIFWPRTSPSIHALMQISEKHVRYTCI